MSINNANNPQLVSVNVGTLAATKTAPALHVPKKSKLASVALVNGAALAKDDTNYLILEVKNGSTVVAALSTKLTSPTAGYANPALSQNVAAKLNVLVEEIPADASLTYTYTKFGTGAPTDAQLVLSLEQL